MSLRSWIRGHRNVFSYTNEWVDAGPEDVDDLEEEYGEQASEEKSVRASRALGWPWRWGWFQGGGRLIGTGPRASVDGILEIGNDSPETEKPPPPTP